MNKWGISTTITVRPFIFPEKNDPSSLCFCSSCSVLILSKHAFKHKSGLILCRGCFTEGEHHFAVARTASIQNGMIVQRYRDREAVIADLWAIKALLEPSFADWYHPVVHKPQWLKDTPIPRGHWWAREHAWVQNPDGAFVARTGPGRCGTCAEPVWRLDASDVTRLPHLIICPKCRKKAADPDNEELGFDVGFLALASLPDGGRDVMREDVLRNEYRNWIQHLNE